jgi:hypothetical protein
MWGGRAKNANAPLLSSDGHTRGLIFELLRLSFPFSDEHPIPQIRGLSRDASLFPFHSLVRLSILA